MPQKLANCCTCFGFTKINDWLNPIISFQVLENDPDTKEDDVLEVVLAPEKVETFFYLMFAAMMVSAKIIMPIWGPEGWMDDNPIHNFFGVHHMCVYTDAAPATYITPIVYCIATLIYVLYWALVVFRMGRHRSAGNLPKWFSLVWKASSSFTLFAALFFVTSFAVKPSENVYMHSIPFVTWMVAIVVWEFMTGLEVLYYPCLKTERRWRIGYFVLVIIFVIFSIVDAFILFALLAAGGISESKFAPNYANITNFMPPQDNHFANAFFHPSVLDFWSIVDQIWYFLLLLLCFSPHLLERSCVKISFQLTSSDGKPISGQIQQQREASPTSMKTLRTARRVQDSHVIAKDTPTDKQATCIKTEESPVAQELAPEASVTLVSMTSDENEKNDEKA